MTPWFTPELLTFFQELAAHNEREWFQQNKQRYEQQVRDPLLRFLEALAPRLAEVSPHFVVDPRPVGGSLMRIHRDTRFSKDKSPYKTSLSAQFWHVAGKDSSAPGLYLHLEPGHSGTGAGLWKPETPTLAAIRQAIAADADGWRQATSLGARQSLCGWMGESLKKVPAGFDPAHPCAEDLKRKDYALSLQLDDATVCSGELLEVVVDQYRALHPFLVFLAKAVGLPA